MIQPTCSWDDSSKAGQTFESIVHLQEPMNRVTQRKTKDENVQHGYAKRRVTVAVSNRDGFFGQPLR